MQFLHSITKRLLFMNLYFSMQFYKYDYLWLNLPRLVSFTGRSHVVTGLLIISSPFSSELELWGVVAMRYVFIFMIHLRHAWHFWCDFFLVAILWSVGVWVIIIILCLQCILFCVYCLYECYVLFMTFLDPEIWTVAW